MSNSSTCSLRHRPAAFESVEFTRIRRRAWTRSQRHIISSVMLLRQYSQALLIMGPLPGIAVCKSLEHRGKRRLGRKTGYACRDYEVIATDDSENGPCGVLGRFKRDNARTGSALSSVTSKRVTERVCCNLQVVQDSAREAHQRCDASNKLDVRTTFLTVVWPPLGMFLP